ncbi:glycoside hydrolase family 3 C-terminal domain-containing protein [Nesterenkonia sp. CL21]|uniref:glycoside hydrolase family 3 C-terminal domain-containing protein n=1 Tax=Nesterenkonia sp. CL21 TaxID=3064894 RepID=UPI00287A9A8B|nr:glycoside hydrolase family 3 C-terminal domain-containing protein [Nesterenkonia sp. CL21]MDS2172127.1 glycoside hydrolase family 3 C-terminal domain-containing protein [Nesterenkonia sp. CL21]
MTTPATPSSLGTDSSPDLFAEAEPRDVVARLSLEQKAELVTGATFWTTAAVEEAGIPAIMVTDGPHGLRKQGGAADHLGLEQSVPATCFPPAVALGSAFDTDLAERVGAAIGAEARAEGVGVVLGPGLNIKRSPLCGRSFEYFSEDPLVSGELAAAVTRGIQSRGVGACLKHFAANNQEHDRMRVSSDVDARPLREIYLRGFERAIASARPWTVMSAYNKINGVSASEDPWLLTEVLRDQWGFDGLVISDWFAVGDRVEALRAGLDLEMPTTGGASQEQVIAAVQEGDLDEAALDRCAARVVELVQKVQAGARTPAVDVDVQAHHALAREAAARSAVLLKNDDEILPLDASASVAVIGEFARTPRYQGAGSSQINPTRVDDALTAITAASRAEVRFAPGFPLEGAEETASGTAESLRAEAAEAAGAADVAVVFLGLPAADESEGFDREHLDLPAEQLNLLEAVVEANPRTVVVLSHGGVVALPFAQTVPAILEGWLLGQAGGSATADLLYGTANPSGRLTETIPLRLADSPAYLDFPGEHGHVRYGEGVFVGYRWYDARDLDVAFPFGHGLSYTRFEHTDLDVSVEADELRIRTTITNTGERDGHEVVQVYVGRPGSAVARAPRELKAFTAVALQAGESQIVELRVPRQDLAHWDRRLDRWVVEGGEHVVAVGASSRDLRQETRVEVPGDEVAVPLTRESTLGDALAHPLTGPLVREAVQEAAQSGGGGDVFSAEGLMRMLESFPLGRLGGFSTSGMDQEWVDGLIARTRRG